ncbi:threonine ammonia-lyase IlvA [Oricola cellulosilytica]|uniref:L-threonine dehydratase n=1 Tax=Oricola cellulosilytica TaxID=1429082 RepID=A0A4R0P8J0_9HYPH|nr:threonine ammonia-lyase IlvA [Oricola cellulosilytica]TCD12316.1 threonine dehydratase [Oricola cellulosilytica]
MTGFLKDVAEATRAMRDLFPETPLQENVFLSQKHGCRIFLKREDLSPVRSYKIRGAFNFIRKRLAEGAHGPFVCASAGNHAQGLAFVCRHFGKHGVIFMPVTTPQQKIDKTRAFGGDNIEIRLVGDYFDDCNRAALAYAEAEGAVMVPPFDHADIIEGQASVAEEVLAQAPAGVSLDRVVVAVGGGGLASGLTRYFEDSSQGARFTLTEPAGAPSLRKSLEAGDRVQLKTFSNFVDGAAVGQIGAATHAILKRFAPGDVTLVPEDRLCTTIIEMLNVEGIVLEPAGALTVDALKDIPERERRGKTILCIASGGNFDFERLAEVKERALRSDGLKKYFVLRMPQRPGALKDFLDLLGPDDDITRFEYLKKSARNFGSVLIGIETKNPGNFAGLMARMNDSGLAWQDISENDLMAGLLV